jgi:methionyl-tRNA formyltransferase
VPIKGVARELDLPIHHLDTFTGWKPPSPFDLVIAVSFGLLVPARILNGTTYGGLNVHPSMLPDLRGAAPIQHAILDGRRYTGVTVQTMHPEEFDHGMILDQTPSPGIEIGEECTTEDLTSQLGPLGAAMLRETIDQGLFISPEAVTRESEVESPSLKHAPKITPEDGRIDWDTWPSDRILRAGRALGRLWDTSTVLRCNAAAEECRVTFEGKWKLVDAGKVGDMSSMRPGSPGPIFSQQTRQVEIAFRTIDGRFVSPGSVTVAGHGKGKGVAFLLRLLTCEVSKLP